MNQQTENDPGGDVPGPWVNSIHGRKEGATMAKRRTGVKLSKTQMLDNEVNRWAAKFEAAVDMLMRSRLRLADARRKQQRNAKKLLAEKEAKRAARSTAKSEAVEPTKPEQEPVRAIPYSEAHPHSKVAKEKKRKAKAEASLDPVKLDGDIKAELQAANDRLAKAWNSSLGPKNLLKAKGGEPSKDQVVAERTKRMKAMGFRPTKR